MECLEAVNFFDLSQDLFCIMGTDGYLKKVNDSFQSAVGHSREKLLTNPVSKFLHEEDVSAFTDYFSDGNVTVPQEAPVFRFKYLDKSYKWLSWKGVKIEGKPYVYMSVQDLSPQIALEEQLKKAIQLQQHSTIEPKTDKGDANESRFKGLLQTGSDIVAILNQVGCYTYVSPAVFNVFGYDPDALLGKSIVELIHPEHQEMVQTSLKLVSQQFRVDIPIYKSKSANGEWRWMKTTVTNLSNDESIKGIVANSKDVTEQILAERHEKRAVLRLKNLIENYTQGYFSLDKDWVIKAVNPATLKLLNMTADMLINKSLVDLFPNRESTFYEQYALAVRESRFVEFEERIINTNRWFQIAAYPYEDGLTVFFKEVTNEKVQQLLVSLEKEVLELNVITKTTLRHTARTYLQGLANIYGYKCLLSLYDRNRSLLMPFSAPALPSEYLKTLKGGFPVCDKKGSCGAAAFNKEPYVVGDIASHPNYEGSEGILLNNDLLSCWSLPLINAHGRLLGTLAVYHDNIGVPDDKERDLIKRVSAFLQMLIESHQIKERLMISNERFKYITLATNDATYDWNLLNEYLYWGEGAGKLFGYHEKKNRIEDWVNRIHPTDRVRIDKSLAEALNNPDVICWHQEYQYQRADSSYAFVIEDGYILRNKANKPIRMVGVLKDITKLKEDANYIMQQNERLQEIARINSHSIRKPLANVLGIINTLKYSEGDHTQELMKMLEESGEELDKVIRMIAEKTNF